MTHTIPIASLLAAATIAASAAATPYAPALKLEPPDVRERATGGLAQQLVTGQMAHRATGAPASVCPSAGMPTDADFVGWFELWSVSQVGGWAMATNPASYVPLLVPKPELANGQTEAFHVGAAPVKKVAMCIYPTGGTVTAQDVELRLTRRGLTAGACANVAAPPCEAVETIADPLNNLFILSRVNDPEVEYRIEVTAPPQGAIGIHLGGRLGSYPQLAFESN